jgi:threonine synthase
LLKKVVEKGEIERNERIVCITTGHLLKDPERVIEICEVPKEVDADVVRKMLKEV